jgi:hypothetical protein
MLAGCGFRQDLICLRIRDENDNPISEATLKKVFRKELLSGRADVDALVMGKFMAAIHAGQMWALRQYIAMRWWQPQFGG